MKNIEEKENLWYSVLYELYVLLPFRLQFNELFNTFTLKISL